MHGRHFELVINAKGHAGISCMDPNKIIITKGSKVFDDSVIAVSADCSAAELPAELKTALTEAKRLTITIHTAGTEDTFTAYGSYELKMTDKKNMVFTKSDFIDPATVGVSANKASCDLSRELTRLLRDPEQEIRITLAVMR